MNIKKFLTSIIPTVTAEAHCDIPCGVYEPTPAKIAAKTIQRMVMQITELALPTPETKKEFLNSMIRRVAVKESHADICEKELMTLWADFFKPEHRQKFPGLDAQFWNAIELCSKNKQHVDAELAQKLVDAVDEIAKIFYEVKNDAARYDAYKTITDKVF